MPHALKKDFLDRNDPEFRVFIKDLCKDVEEAEKDIADGRVYDISECKGKVVAKYAQS